MMTLKKLIVANWKMNGSIDKISQDLKFYATHITTNLLNVVLAIPALFIFQAKQQQANFNIASQDVSKFSGYGAYTGEISASMLRDIEVKYVLIGHSERRQNFEENDSVLHKKLENVIHANIIPIFCIGEDIKLRENNKYQEFLLNQLELLNKLTCEITQLIIAYEPIWAIGTGKIPTQDEIAEIMILIHSFVQKYLPHVKITTLYGGSVTAGNITEILQIPNVGGVLVGGASLKPEEFVKICESA